MTRTETRLDPAKLEQFVFRAVDEVGATLNAALVVMGDSSVSTAPWPAPGRSRPPSSRARTGTAERYVREWLDAQAAGGYVDYDTETGRYTLPPEQAAALSRRAAPPSCPASSRSRWRSCSTRRGSPRRPAPATASAGTSTTRVPEGSERFFRPGYRESRRRVAARARRRRREARARRAGSPTSAAATAPRRS